MEHITMSDSQKNTGSLLACSDPRKVSLRMELRTLRELQDTRKPRPNAPRMSPDAIILLRSAIAVTRSRIKALIKEIRGTSISVLRVCKHGFTIDISRDNGSRIHVRAFSFQHSDNPVPMEWPSPMDHEGLVTALTEALRVVTTDQTHPHDAR
jgi:hypothetical protein